MEPTGPAWLPVVVFFEKRGHLVFRASSAQSADLRRFLSRHAKSNRIDADALARLPLFVDHLKPVRLPTGDQASLERRVRLCDRLVAEAGSRKTRIRASVREMLPMTPLADDLTKADLAILERTGGNPRRLLEMGRTRLVRLVKKTSHGHLGEDRAVVWMDAAQQSLELYEQSPAIAFEDRADAVKTELALLKTCEAELAKHQLQREAGYRRVDPDQLMCSLPGVAEVGAPVLSVFLVQPSRYPNGRHFVSYTGLVAESSETGDSDRKGQGMSKAGTGLFRTTLVRAANTARQQDPHSRRSTTGRWWSEEPLTRRRSAWSPPILPSAPIGSPPRHAVPTSRPRRPPPHARASTADRDHHLESAGGGAAPAAEQEDGEGPSAIPLRECKRSWRDEAAFPVPHPGSRDQCRQPYAPTNRCSHLTSVSPLGNHSGVSPG